MNVKKIMVELEDGSKKCYDFNSFVWTYFYVLEYFMYGKV